MSKKPKTNLREISVHMGMFDFVVNVVVGKESEAREYVTWKFDRPESDIHIPVGTSLGCTFTNESRAPVIWIPRFPTKPREYGTLAHECFHAVCDMARWVDIGLALESEEVFCHAVSYLMMKILEAKK